jgi:hypothetical protein
VPLLVLGAVGLFIMRRRNQGKGNQPLPPPPVEEVSEYYKAQPAPPALKSGGARHNPYYVRSPFFPFHSFRVGDLLLRRFVIQNPEDPTTFPPQVADGHSSLTYLNPPSLRAQGQGQYSGVPEI